MSQTVYTMSVLFGFKKNPFATRCMMTQLEPEEFEKLKRSGTFEAGFFEKHTEKVRLKQQEPPSEFITRT